MYCESLASQQPLNSSEWNQAHTTLMDFWSRVTPGILLLLSQPKLVRLLALLVSWFVNE